MNSMDLITPLITIDFNSQNPNVIITVFCLYCFCTFVPLMDIPRKMFTRNDHSRGSGSSLPQQAPRFD